MAYFGRKTISKKLNTFFNNENDTVQCNVNDMLIILRIESDNYNNNNNKTEQQ